MNTKVTMKISAVIMACLGLAFSFVPNELIIYFGIAPNSTVEILFQLIGALYFSMAVLNWMSSGSIIGGIYNKPIAMANFAHFLIGGMALIKWVSKSNGKHFELIGLALFYLVFASIFALIAFQHPKPSQDSTNE